MSKTKEQKPRPPLSSGLGKVPPQAVELEKSVLGAVLTESQSIFKILQIIKPDTFYHPSHQIIWTAALNLVAKDAPIDTITVIEELRAMKKLNEGELSPHYIVTLVDNIMGSANIENHARKLEEKAIARRSISAMMNTVSELYNDTDDVFDVLALSDQELFQARSSLTSIKDITPLTIGEKLKSHIERGLHMKGITGIRSGVAPLDELTGGWQNQSLITIGARPRIGKSAVAAAFMDEAAMDGDPQVMFSMEMRDIEFFVRIISKHLRREGLYIPYSRIMTARLSTEEYEMVGDMITSVSKAPIYIDDSPNLSPLEMKTRLRRYLVDYGIKAAYFDYIQLMKLMQMYGRNDATALSDAMSEIKNTAKYLDLPIIALSQISREVEKKAGGTKGESTIADMKGSAGIEEKSDMIILLNRPDIYESDPIDENGLSTKGLVDINVAKNKMGATGHIWVPFDLGTNYFGEGENNIPFNEKAETLINQGFTNSGFKINPYPHDADDPPPF